MLLAQAMTSADAVRTLFDPAWPAYLLVDPLVGDPMGIVDRCVDLAALRAAREAAWQREVHAIPLPPRIDLPAHLHPYLVALRGPADSWWAGSVEMALAEREQMWCDALSGTGMVPHRIGGWLNSSMHASDLVDHLANLMCVRTVAPTAARYVRMGDPRVLAWFRFVMGESVLAAAMGRIQCWAYLDVLGRPTAVRSSGEVPQLPTCTRSQWDAFMEGSLVHPALARRLSHCPPVHSQDQVHQDIGQLYRQALEAVRRARRVATRWPDRFAEPTDLTAWAALVMLHPGIEHRQDVADRMNGSAEIDGSPDTVHILCSELDQLCCRHPQSIPDPTLT